MPASDSTSVPPGRSAAPRPSLLGIRHVALFVDDLEKATAFWTGVMGYAVEWRPDPDNVYLTCGRDNLALHRGAPIGGGPLDHVGLAVPSAADVDRWAAHLGTAGVALDREPKTHRDGSRSLYFRAPGGILVQILHHGPISNG